MVKELIPAIRITVVLAILIGLVFPFAMTGIAQVFFAEQANGSLVRNKAGQIVGSRLIGQQFVKPQYFHSRPSAAGSGYSAETSAGTNLAPTSFKLILGQKGDSGAASFAGVKQLAEAYCKENHLTGNEKPPVDAVTRSGSGLDPHISIANAMFQARRVSKERGLAMENIVDLIQRNTDSRQFGILGEPGVNVLMLNLALDEAVSK